MKDALLHYNNLNLIGLTMLCCRPNCGSIIWQQDVGLLDIVHDDGFDFVAILGECMYQLICFHQLRQEAPEK